MEVETGMKIVQEKGKIRTNSLTLSYQINLRDFNTADLGEKLLSK